MQPLSPEKVPIRCCRRTQQLQWPPPLQGPDPAPGMSLVVRDLLKGDAVQRAAAAWHLSWPPAVEASGASWQSPYLAELLDDPYSAVRAIAGESLKKLPHFGDFNYDYAADKPSQESAKRKARDHWMATTNDIKANEAILMTDDGVDRTR